jgi:hypothetical protein
MSFESNGNVLEIKNADKVKFVGTSNTVIDNLTGRIGVGIDEPTSALDVNGDVEFRSNVQFTGELTTERIGPVSSELNVDGTMIIKNDIRMGDHKESLSTINGPLLREDLYTWQADTAVSNTVGQQNEPFNYNGSFSRIKLFGNAIIGLNSSYWNEQYLVYPDILDKDVTTPTNYVSFSLPVKYVNSDTFSHAFFVKFISNDRRSSATVFVKHPTNGSFYRLQNQVNNVDGGTGVTRPQTFLIGPNGEPSHSHKFHEWQMFSIPQYVVEEYSFVEMNDNKSVYNKNIELVLIAGKNNENDDILYMSGLAMRVNPYGLTFHPVVAAHWAANGGSAITWHDSQWNSGDLGRFNADSNYTNILIPICPPKDPSTNEYPDFYLGFVGHASATSETCWCRVYLDDGNGGYEYLGRPNFMYKGRYGRQFGSRQREECFGFYVPSPSSSYIHMNGGRPYLRIRVDTNNNGTGVIVYMRGFYTEVVFKDGSKDGFGYNTLITR